MVVFIATLCILSFMCGITVASGDEHYHGEEGTQPRPGVGVQDPGDPNGENNCDNTNGLLNQPRTRAKDL